MSKLLDAIKKILAKGATELAADDERTINDIVAELSTELSKAQEKPQTQENIAHIEEIKQLREDVKALSQLVANERTEREKAQGVIRQRLEDEKKQKIADAIRKAKEEKRIPAQDADAEEKWKKLLEADFDTAADTLNKTSPMAEPKTETQTASSSASQTQDKAALRNAAVQEVENLISKR